MRGCEGGRERKRGKGEGNRHPGRNTDRQIVKYTH